MRSVVKLSLLVAMSIACQDHKSVVLEKSDAEKDTRRYNPSAIIFSVYPPELGAMSGFDKKKVPTVRVKLDEGEIPISFYQVQRCHHSIKVLDRDGKDPLTTEYPTYRTMVEYLFAWGKANVNDCISLGGKHRQKVFEDITAPSGKYFYLFRPCLSAGRSQFGKRRTCHYLYRKTDVINYVDKFGQDTWRLRLELDAMRNRLQSQFNQLSDLIITKANYLHKCETREANRCTSEARWAGVSKLVLTAAAATTATILSGGTAAFIAGAAAIKIGDKLVSGSSNCQLQCDTSIFDKRIEEIKEGIVPIAEAIGKKLNALAEREPPPE